MQADNLWQINNLENSSFSSKIGWGNATGLSERYRVRSATSLKDGPWIAAIIEHQSKESPNGDRLVVSWRIVAVEVNGTSKKQLTHSEVLNENSRVVRIDSVSSTELLIVVAITSPINDVATSVFVWNILNDKIEVINDGDNDNFKRQSRLDFWLCFDREIKGVQADSKDLAAAYFGNGVGFRNRFYSPDQDGLVSTISNGFEVDAAICASNTLEFVAYVKFGNSKPIWSIDRASLAKYVEIAPNSKVSFWTAYSQKPFESRAPVFVRIGENLYIIVLNRDGTIQTVFTTGHRFLASSPFVSLDTKSVLFTAYGDGPQRKLVSVDLESSKWTVSESFAIDLCRIDGKRVYGFLDEGLVSRSITNESSLEFVWMAFPLPK